MILEGKDEFRQHIRVAEEDENNFKLIKASIGKKCEMHWAKDGIDIIKLFQEHRNEAKDVLVDIKMALMTGIEATVEIRKEDKEIPIIMQTAYAFNSAKEIAMRSGATQVLVKPITLNVLRNCLSEYMPDIIWN